MHLIDTSQGAMPADNAVLISAVVTLAKARGREWLAAELERVTLAFIANEAKVKSLSVEGRSVLGEYEVTTAELMQILTQALDTFDGKADVGGSALIMRFGRNGIPY
jgi:RecA-family ATPase